MADLAASDVAYTVLSQTVSNFSGKSTTATLVFGDGSKTYPTGGIPLTGSSLGLPNTISRLDIFDLGTSGYSFSYDLTNNKIRIFTGGAHSHNLILKNAAVADGATTRVNAGANLLGANTGADLTITGAGANGGIAVSGAGAAAELAGGSTVVASNVTIKVMAMGW